MAGLRIVFHAEFSPSSRYMLIAALPIVGSQGRIWIYDTLSGQLIGEPIAYLHPANPRILEQGVRLPMFRFDPAEERVLIADLKEVNVWSLKTAQKVFSGPKLADFVRCSFTNIWIKQDGRWQLTARQATIISKE